MVRKNARNKEHCHSGVLFDSKTKAVMALNTVEGIKEKVQAVREVVPNHSNDQIVLVLQYYDYSIEQAIQAFVENGAKQALEDWHYSGSKPNNKKKKKNKNKAGSMSASSTASSVTTATTTLTDETATTESPPISCQLVSPPSSDVPSKANSASLTGGQLNGFVNGDDPLLAEAVGLLAPRLATSAQGGSVSLPNSGDITDWTLVDSCGDRQTTYDDALNALLEKHQAHQTTDQYECSARVDMQPGSCPPPYPQETSLYQHSHHQSAGVNIAVSGMQIPAAECCPSLHAANSQFYQHQQHQLQQQQHCLQQQQQSLQQQQQQQQQQLKLLQQQHLVQLPPPLPQHILQQHQPVQQQQLPHQSLQQQQQHQPVQQQQHKSLQQQQQHQPVQQQQQQQQQQQALQQQQQYVQQQQQQPPQQPLQQEQEQSASSASMPAKRPHAGLEKSLKDLHRQTVSLQRLKHVLDDELEKSAKKITQFFEEMRCRLNEREATVVYDLYKVKKEANETFLMRQKRASDLKVLTNRAAAMSESELAALRMDVKHFVSDRKIDEELGSTTRFVCDIDHFTQEIDKFGSIVPVKAQYRHVSTEPVTTSTSTATVSISAVMGDTCKTTESDQSPVTSPAPSVPTTTLAVDQSQSVKVVNQSESVTKYEVSELQMCVSNREIQDQPSSTSQGGHSGSYAGRGGYRGQAFAAPTGDQPRKNSRNVRRRRNRYPREPPDHQPTPSNESRSINHDRRPLIHDLPPQQQQQQQQYQQRRPFNRDSSPSRRGRGQRSSWRQGSYGAPHGHGLVNNSSMPHANGCGDINSSKIQGLPQREQREQREHRKAGMLLEGGGRGGGGGGGGRGHHTDRLHNGFVQINGGV